MRIAFVSHDVGGATMLLPVIEAMRETSHELALLPVGPANARWSAVLRENDLPVANPDEVQARLDLFTPHLIVTGTSHYSPLERMTWSHARASGSPTFALIDSWTNFRERFEDPDTREVVLPDRVGVIDEWCRSQVHTLVSTSLSVEVVGHPYLERLSAAFDAEPEPAQDEALKTIVFFSNPVGKRSDGYTPPYNAFEVAGMVLDATRKTDGLAIAIKPHPSETPENWTKWLKDHAQDAPLPVQLVDDSALSLFKRADIVIGMTSMALVEAAILGRPVISVQPGQQKTVNPMIERLENTIVVDDNEALSGAISSLVSTGSNTSQNVGLSFMGSTAEVMQIVEDMKAPV